MQTLITWCHLIWPCLTLFTLPPPGFFLTYPLDQAFSDLCSFLFLESFSPQTFTALSPSHKSVLTEMLCIQKDLLWLPKIAPFPPPDKNCPFALFPFHHSPQYIYNDLVCLSMSTSLSVFPPSQRGKLREVRGKLWTTGHPASRTMCDTAMNEWVQRSFWAVIQNKRHESTW